MTSDQMVDNHGYFDFDVILSHVMSRVSMYLLECKLHYGSVVFFRAFQ